MRKLKGKAISAKTVKMKVKSHWTVSDFLKNYGCDYLQGFYFSKAVSEEEFEKLLDSQSGIVI